MNNKKIMSSTATQDQDSALKAAAEKFYVILQDFVEKQIENYLKENDFYRLVTGQVEKVGRFTCSVDIGDITIHNVLNKSNRNLERGDTVTILDRYGSNFRNSFVLCVNGKETPFQEDVEAIEKNIKTIEDNIANLQEQIDDLKSYN